MFGSSSASAPPAGGGLFGSAQTGTSNTGGTSLFGAPKPAGQTPAAPAFGSSTTGGGLFGSNNTAQGLSTFGGPLLTAGAASSGGLFGAKPATLAPSGGGLFGSSPANNTGLAPAGGLFGNKNTVSAAPATTSGLFGANSNSGAPGAAPAAGGLFGSSAPAAPATGGLFGSNGSNNSNATAGGLFGKPAVTAASGGLFGAAPAAPVASNAPSLFAVNSAQPSFGWASSAPQTQPANAFANTNAQSAASAVPNSTINTNTNTTAYIPTVNDQFLKIKEQWDPSSSKAVLKTHFYNKLSELEAQIANQQPRPATETPEDWDAAMGSRPSHLYYPVKVSSFTEVAQRIEVQLEHVAKSRVVLGQINEKQTQLSSKHDLNNTTRILKAKTKHVQLLRRLLRLATVLAILKLKGYPLLPEEEEISKQFEILNSKLTDPLSALGKMNDVYARLAILKDRLEDLACQFDTNIRHLSAEDPSAEESKETSIEHNDEIIEKVSKILLKFQIGLNHLNGVLEKDTEVVDRIQRR